MSSSPGTAKSRKGTRSKSRGTGTASTERVRILSGRTHFSRAKLGKPFPPWLLYHQYCFDEWESCLIMEPSHKFGTPTSSGMERCMYSISCLVVLLLFLELLIHALIQIMSCSSFYLLVFVKLTLLFSIFFIHPTHTAPPSQPI